MSYKLEKQEALPANVKRVATEELEGALISLATLNLHEAVHDIRKRLKKLRALLRLVRDEMGEDNYKELNIFFRDLGRELSAVRDLTAHMETMEALRQRYGDHLYVDFFNSVNKEIDKQRQELEEQLREEEFFSRHITEKLQKAKEKVDKWPVKNEQLEVAFPSIQRVYKRGYTALQETGNSADDKLYHEWRKRVKYLWYHSLLLEDLWPGLLQPLQEEIHHLANLLGDDHDLVTLNQKLDSGDLDLKDNKQQEVLQALIREYSNDLREQARVQGNLIYAEKPSAFTKRLEKYSEANWN